MSQSDPTFEEEDLSALLDGELSAAEQAALEERIRTDPALQAEYEALAEARSFFAKHGPVAAPADLLGDILAAAERIDTEEGNVVQLSWYKRPLGIPVAGWAVAAAAMLVVYVALPGGERHTPDTTRVDAAAQAPTKSLPPGSISSYGGDTKQPAVEKEAVNDVPDDNDAVAMIEPRTPNAEQVNDSKFELPVGQQLVSDKGNQADKKLEKVLKTALPNEAVGSAADATTAGGEGAAAGSGVGFAQVPYQYTLYTDDSQALLQLAAIAGRYRGELAGPNDSPLELEELQGTEAATVIVKLPAHALKDFGRAIEGLGNVYSSADNRVFAGDPVEVRVRVQLSAGKNGQADEVPNAARQRQKSFDAAEIAETL